MVGLPRAIIKQYGVSKKAWAVFRGRGRVRSSGRRKASRATGGRMARRRSRGYSRGGGFSRGSDFLDGAVAGIGSAALAKRFIGAPLGTFTGAAAGAGYAMLKHKNMLACALGGYVHDNIGNVGGATGSVGMALG